MKTICLEEDSAKKVGTKNGCPVFRLDRLGIPLIGISTESSINTPQEAQETAVAVRKILRMTNFVKRGLGTIRQDINVSIKNGYMLRLRVFKICL